MDFYNMELLYCNIFNADRKQTTEPLSEITEMVWIVYKEEKGFGAIYKGGELWFPSFEQAADYLRGLGYEL